MRANKIVIYAIPGWGFSAKIFDLLTTRELNFIGLDYFKTATSSIELIAQRLSSHITDKAILLGWSLGGLLALKLATLFPTKIRKLILISSQPKFIADDDWAGISSNSANNFVTQFNADSKKQTTQFIDLVNYPNRTVSNKIKLTKFFLHNYTTTLSPLLRILFETDLRKDYQNLTLSTLHIINEKDLVIKQNEQQFKLLNPKVTFIKISHCGHAGFLNDSATYQNIIRSFCLNE